MPNELEPAVEAQSVEYRAYSRHFEHDETDENSQRGVLYVIATMSFPDSGWEVMLVPQADEPDTWPLLADKPSYRDGNRTYLIACGTSEHELPDVPKNVRVINGDDVSRVSVVPWD